jgi:predicted Zn-dependent peptidase
MTFEYEELPSGITAVFGHMPHYQTSSARLMFEAGALHEALDAPPGVAHFLEHTPFQGTEQFPSLDTLKDYVESDGSYYNAWTDQTSTTYIADGIDLYKTMNTVFQLGFHPLLTTKGLEDDRNAVIEEAREEQFDPYRPEIRNYYELFGGPRYAQLVQGNIEDIAQISHDQITKFYEAHYQKSNAFLVVCSSVPIAKQRKIANQLASEIDDTRTISDPQPVKFDLPWLTPSEPISTFHNRKDEEEAQSGVSVGYDLPVPLTFEEYILLEVAIKSINLAIHNRIRDKLNLAYGACAGLTAIENSNHGIAEYYYAMEMHTTLAGSSVVRALDAIHHIEDKMISDVKHAQAAILKKVREILEALQAAPSATADNITESGQIYYDEKYSPLDELEIVQNLTAAQVALKAAGLLKNRRITNIAGPDVKQLSTAERYAARFI